jgi:hypothetical protein
MKRGARAQCARVRVPRSRESIEADTCDDCQSYRKRESKVLPGEPYLHSVNPGARRGGLEAGDRAEGVKVRIGTAACVSVHAEIGHRTSRTPTGRTRTRRHVRNRSSPVDRQALARSRAGRVLDMAMAGTSHVAEASSASVVRGRPPSTSKRDDHRASEKTFTVSSAGRLDHHPPESRDPRHEDRRRAYASHQRSSDRADRRAPSGAHRGRGGGDDHPSRLPGDPFDRRIVHALELLARRRTVRRVRVQHAQRRELDPRRIRPNTSRAFDARRDAPGLPDTAVRPDWRPAGAGSPRDPRSTYPLLPIGART